MHCTLGTMGKNLNRDGVCTLKDLDKIAVAVLSEVLYNNKYGTPFG